MYCFRVERGSIHRRGWLMERWKNGRQWSCVPITPVLLLLCWIPRDLHVHRLVPYSFVFLGSRMFSFWGQTTSYSDFFFFSSMVSGSRNMRGFELEREDTLICYFCECLKLWNVKIFCKDKVYFCIHAIKKCEFSLFWLYSESAIILHNMASVLSVASNFSWADCHLLWLIR